ncbi:MAG: RecQ family ATP-dependent DNA helicase [Microthrixaceae bacterium]|nr:ATP-dependent DNA helicase RecQ [Microthrixaceae bacterium]MCO5311575.1 RecQ family ATP-dependent DNA helicase [Microthrixaceae bacterium]HPB44712.1 RecQ family ATP-dependent DNA helicase [Microthrixaceae bacterium]
MTDVATDATRLLKQLAGPSARLRPAQLEAIEAVVGQRRRALVVQRTGFGKSAVYFIAAKLLRERGAGPALVVSPLLALMRDQVAAAERMGVRSATINSTNLEEWADIEAQLGAGELDLLCISPERLNHPRFAREVLPRLAAGLGLLVIDEAHCISDWGHDFRPDYRRIRDAIANLDPSTPVIATTATANERVSLDVAEQLGDDVLVLRGTLDRESLSLGVTNLATQAERLAWLAQRMVQVEGTGIVYCLTVDQTQQVAEFLQREGLDARAYSGKTSTEERLILEDDFKANRLKALVATSALGMGVDKADVTFVYHLGAPPSPIAYYQQVGRAGRSVDHAEGWLLPGAEDRAIWEYFASVGLPPERLVQRVLEALGDATERGAGPVSVAALERQVDLRRTRLETLLKILDVDGAVERTSQGWVLTGQPWVYDRERVERVEQARRDEADQMVAYATAATCLMRFLREALDDPEAVDCGRCSVCTGSGDPVDLDEATVRRAVEFLRGVDVVVDERKQWPRGNDESMPRGNIKPDRRAQEGRALCRVNDAGWWPLVSRCRELGEADDELIRGVFAALKRWSWGVRPTWVTYVETEGVDPASGAAHLARSVAERIATAGKLQLAPTLTWRGGVGTSSNSAFRATDVWNGLVLEHEPPSLAGPVLLILDEVDSRWTQTVAAYRLLEAGSGPVLPFALILR